MSRIEEINAVKKLGEKIGYGNLMSIASGLWSVDLQKKYGTSSGAFIPVCIYDVKKKCRDEILREQNAVCNEIVGKTML